MQLKNNRSKMEGGEYYFLKAFNRISVKGNLFKAYLFNQ